VRDGESPEVALARELQEELGATLVKSVELGRARHHYAGTPEELEILFYAVEILESEIISRAFEKIAWVLPKELGAYDFLAANAQLVAQLATGRIKPREILENSA
jgi:8-oxo-dGTP diphosphatase